MSMGKRKRTRQQPLFVVADALRQSAGHPFYRRLNEVLDGCGFDEEVERRCERFYADGRGRPSIPPGVYFRMHMIGYFEGLDSERGIAWRVGDSRSLGQFLGYGLADRTPDHSSLSRIRQRIDTQTHEDVFNIVLVLLGRAGLAHGKTIGIDATTLEANAALRSIVRWDTGQRYNDYLKGLAQASGIDTPTREQLAKLDRHRKGKGRNDDWTNPHDPDAKITKMKDGRTHLAHKAEHAVDMESGAVVAVTVQPANAGDTTTWRQTTETACQNLNTASTDPLAAKRMHDKPMDEVVLDKGYHSNDVLTDLTEIGIRSYASEPDRGQRNWQGKAKAKEAVYANRRRIRGQRGKQLLRKRGELVERSFAHAYETGNMRRTHLRGHDKILKRLLNHVVGQNLGLLMRSWFGVGTPRGPQGLACAFFESLTRYWVALKPLIRRWWPLQLIPATWRPNSLAIQSIVLTSQHPRCSTGC